MLITTGNTVLYVCRPQRQSDEHASIWPITFKAMFRRLLSHKLYVFWEKQVSLWLIKVEIKK